MNNRTMCNVIKNKQTNKKLCSSPLSPSFLPSLVRGQLVNTVENLKSQIFTIGEELVETKSGLKWSDH